jgi:hypothetical protein
MAAVEAKVAFAAPDLGDDLERLFERVKGFTRPAPWPTPCFDCFPERPCSETDLEAAITQDIYRCRGLCE